MNTYIVPFCNSSGEIWVDKYQARSLSSAKDKVIEEYTEFMGFRSFCRLGRFCRTTV